MSNIYGVYAWLVKLCRLVLFFFVLVLVFIQFVRVHFVVGVCSTVSAHLRCTLSSLAGTSTGRINRHSMARALLEGR